MRRDRDLRWRQAGLVRADVAPTRELVEAVGACRRAYVVLTGNRSRQRCRRLRWFHVRGGAWSERRGGRGRPCSTRNELDMRVQPGGGVRKDADSSTPGAANADSGRSAVRT